MEKQPMHLIPSIYLANYLNDYEELVKSYGATLHVFEKGQRLTQRGTINNTAWFVKEGVIQLSLAHDDGEKALNLFGAGTVFPIGVEEHEFLIEYEMIIEAFTRVEAYGIPYPVLKQIAVENGEFAGDLLRENCDFVGYLFFDTINQTFEPCMARVCDVLCLYLMKVKPPTSCIPLTQTELAHIAGTSRQQLERTLALLRAEGVISTSRGCLFVTDYEGLLEHCTLGLRTSL